MSRWTTNFSQHPFQEKWKQLNTELSSIAVDDQTIVTSVQELARLKKVVAYLDRLLSDVDPEMIPASLWTSFDSQLDACLQQVRAYASNKQIAHMLQANEHVDNLLSYLKPYNVLPNQLFSALKNSFKAYSDEVDKYLNSFREKSTSLIEEIKIDKENSTERLNVINQEKVAIEGFSKLLFETSEETESVEEKIKKLVALVENKTTEVEKTHELLLVGDDSIYSKIIAAKSSINESKSKIDESLNSVSNRILELRAFHEKIFGTKVAEDIPVTDGLEFELEQRLHQLSVYENDQHSKHEALKIKIESLLPGATSAGLASAYGELKNGFSKPIGNYTKLFYGSLLLLVVAGVTASVQSISFDPVFSLKFIATEQWDTVLRSFLFKAPFVAPVIWLAIFSATRRSQYERLQQEYAHKEALATSYHSYKLQLQDLKIDSDELQKELIKKAIDAVSYNASTTLDGKHEEKLPLHQFLEKLSLDDAKKMIDIFKTNSSR
jgi:hypothetical protein